MIALRHKDHSQFTVAEFFYSTHRVLKESARQRIGCPTTELGWSDDKSGKIQYIQFTILSTVAEQSPRECSCYSGKLLYSMRTALRAIGVLSAMLPMTEEVGEHKSDAKLLKWLAKRQQRSRAEKLKGVASIMKWNVLRTVNVNSQRDCALLTGGFFYSEHRATGAIGTLLFVAFVLEIALNRIYQDSSSWLCEMTQY